MNTISYKELKDWYLNNEDAKANAKKYFGDNQPSLHETGFYSAPSWNWGYKLGIVGVNGTGSDYKTEEGLIYGNGIQSGTVKYFEVVTQFGAVKAAREINIPVI
jgi:hypothetical protein